MFENMKWYFPIKNHLTRRVSQPSTLTKYLSWQPSKDWWNTTEKMSEENYIPCLWFPFGFICRWLIEYLFVVDVISTTLSLKGHFLLFLVDGKTLLFCFINLRMCITNGNHWATYIVNVALFDRVGYLIIVRK